MPTARCCHHTDPPMPNVQPDHGEWWLYKNRIEFETADILFKWCQMSARKIDDLLEIWAASLATHNNEPPFKTTMIYTLRLMPLPFLVVTLNGKPSIFISIMMKNFHPMHPTGRRRRSVMSGTTTLSS